MIAAEPEDLKVHMLRTYVTLRRLMAVLTLTFLVTLALYRSYGGDPVTRNSISAYYHHDNSGFRMKDVFVGALVSVALLLIAYQGYTNREKWVLNAAGTFLLCVVAFPMDWPPVDESKPDAERLPMSAVAWVHYISAVLFFLCLAYVSVCRAKDTLDAVTNPRRKTAYRFAYQVTGTLMGVVPVLAIVLYLLKVTDAVYWVEYAGVCMFLVYWVVKSIELQFTQLETRAKYDEIADPEKPEQNGGNTVTPK